MLSEQLPSGRLCVESFPRIILISVPDIEAVIIPT